MLALRSKKLKKCLGCLPMLYLLLSIFSFDQDILELSLKLKPYISQLQNHKCADLCRIYHLFIQFKDQRKKPKQLMANINRCNRIMEMMEGHQLYQEHQHQSSQLWEEYLKYHKDRPVLMPHGEHMMSYVKGGLEKYVEKYKHRKVIRLCMREMGRGADLISKKK